MKKPVETPTAETKRRGDEVAPGTPQSGEGICPACNGSGRKNDEPCPDCGGSGKVNVLIGDA